MAKKICALTMVRNDEFYLRKWVAYYGAELGVENLYVFLDGKDQEIPDWCPGVNVEAVEARPYNPINLRHYTGNLTEIRPKDDTIFYFKGIGDNK